MNTGIEELRDRMEHATDGRCRVASPVGPRSTGGGGF
jgi:hypothetical protein